MRKLVGPHLAGSWANKLDILRQWQPPFVLLLQPEADKVQQLRAACPDAVIVGRFYHDDNHYSHNISTRPVEFADEIHNEIIGNPVTPLLDYVQTNNEVCQDWQGIGQLNKFSERWMYLADQSQAYKCAILTFSAGNPDMPHKPSDPAGFDGRMLYWQQVLPSLNYAQRNDHLLLLHAYGYPNMFSPDADWYIYRYERQVQANLRTLGITNLKYAYGEIGIDRLIVGEKGGYKVATTDQDYVNQLLQWERDQQGQSLLLGGAVYTFGDSGGWGSYDITSTEVAAMLAANGRADTAPQNTGANNVSNELHIPYIPNQSPTVPAPDLPPIEWDERLTQRGVSVQPVDVLPGGQFWRVTMARWYSEAEAGGRHHIYVDAPDGSEFHVQWPSGGAVRDANGRSGFDAGNFPMSKSLNEFSVTMMGGIPSETLTGIGMGADGNSGIHTSTEVRFELVTMPQAAQPAPPPAVEPVPSATVPYLVHPVADPALRIISQRFGENPQDYAKFGLAGHNGIDFAVPVGTPIHAVDNGKVLEHGYDQSGYGEYLKLGHAWGESLYAHLGNAYMALPNILVRRGQAIGESGNTGNSTGPHLHFAMRVNPYTRGAPYDGYVDPEPYLEGTQKRTSKQVITAAIRAAAHEFGVDADLLLSQAWAESSFNPYAVSEAGAQGLFQFMPATFAEWGPKVGASDPFDVTDSARVGSAYMSWLIDTLNGNEYNAAVAYNAGIGNVINGVTIPPITYEYADRVIFGQGLLKAVEE